MWISLINFISYQMQNQSIYTEFVLNIAFQCNSILLIHSFKFHFIHNLNSNIKIHFSPSFLILTPNPNSSVPSFQQITQRMLQKPKKLNVPSHKQLSQTKIALVGNSQTGKTSLLSKYINNQCPNYYQATLGVQTFDKYLLTKNGSQLHVTFWDFSGKIDFCEIRNQFYKECSKVVIVCDLGNKSSVEDIDVWVKQIKEAGGTCPIVVVGNKADIKKVGDADKTAKSNGCGYHQVSAKSGQNVNQMFEQIVAEFR